MMNGLFDIEPFDHGDAVVRRRLRCGVIQGKNYKDPTNDLSRLWSGLINFINDVMGYFGVPKIAEL